MARCELCNDTGLIPFRRKDGSIVPHAYVDCECKGVPSADYHPYPPDILDFPVSRDFYRQFAQYYHWPDPGSVQSESTSVIREITKLQNILPVVVQPKHTQRLVKKSSGIEL
ncbi:MAG: hypothetical protein PHG35_02185 [Dehalococcoidales bacterium]|nr:hypothetical protein [Dehalococcoidales bacterium]